MVRTPVGGAVTGRGVERAREAVRSLRRALWFTGGGVALGLGGLGVFLPVLPTTPFVILAAFCFGKSAPSLARRLEESRTFGPMILDWRTYGAIAPRYKTIAIAMMAGVFALSLATGVSTTVLAVQAVCICGAAGFILSRPSGRVPRSGRESR